MAAKSTDRAAPGPLQMVLVFTAFLVVVPDYTVLGVAGDIDDLGVEELSEPFGHPAAHGEDTSFSNNGISGQPQSSRVADNARRSGIYGSQEAWAAGISVG